MALGDITWENLPYRNKSARNMLVSDPRMKVLSTGTPDIVSVSTRPEPWDDKPVPRPLDFGETLVSPPALNARAQYMAAQIVGRIPVIPNRSSNFYVAEGDGETFYYANNEYKLNRRTNTVSLERSRDFRGNAPPTIPTSMGEIVGVSDDFFWVFNYPWVFQVRRTGGGGTANLTRINLRYNRPGQSWHGTVDLSQFIIFPTPNTINSWDVLCDPQVGRVLYDIPGGSTYQPGGYKMLLRFTADTRQTVEVNSDTSLVWYRPLTFGFEPAVMGGLVSQITGNGYPMLHLQGTGDIDGTDHSPVYLPEEYRQITSSYDNYNAEADRVSFGSDRAFRSTPVISSDPLQPQSTSEFNRPQFLDLGGGNQLYIANYTPNPAQSNEGARGNTNHYRLLGRIPTNHKWQVAILEGDFSL